MTDSQVLLLMLVACLSFGVRYLWKIRMLPGKFRKRLWELLKQAPMPIHEILAIGSFWGITKDMQEYICQNRPDLITQIPDLHPDLKAKYYHEVELAGVDV